MSNGFRNMVKARTGDAPTKGKRRKLDDYETPPESGAVSGLLTFVKFRGPIFEPACGSMLMVKELRALTGLKVTGSDIKTGADFMQRVKTFPGDIVTNPPYRGGLAERFSRHALKLADGKVAMLVQSGFLWGGKRAAGLFADYLPSHVVIIPNRIYFHVNGKPIPAQFYTHTWVVWPERKVRERRSGHGSPTIHWAPASEFD